MNESIQLTSSAGAGGGKAAVQSKGAPETRLENGSEPSQFTAVYANYLESAPASGDQAMDESLADMLAELTPQELLEDGKQLPDGDMTAIWQAYFQLQPAENVLANNEGLVTQQAKGLNLFDSQRAPLAGTAILNQGFLQSSGFKIDDQTNALTDAGAVKNIISQLAVQQLDPATKETTLFNLGDQLTPVHATNSTLSNSLAALGFASGTATQAATTQTQMAPLSLTHTGWESNLGTRLQMLIGQHSQQADIRLDPPDLGTLDVKIKITHDTATVSFSSPHSHVRDALESAVPRLREMFAESGLSLGDVNVRQESFAQQQNQQGDGGQITGGFTSFSREDENHEAARKIISNNLLDTYA